MKDCYECKYAEFDTEEYYGGGKEKIVTDCNSPDFCSEQLHVGDCIKCKDRDDMINTMHDLIMEGIETEFKYERHGQKGLWLEVIKVGN
jgi:hypothetical protein